MSEAQLPGLLTGSSILPADGSTFSVKQVSLLWRPAEAQADPADGIASKGSALNWRRPPNNSTLIVSCLRWTATYYLKCSVHRQAGLIMLPPRSIPFWNFYLFIHLWKIKCMNWQVINWEKCTLHSFFLLLWHN